MGTPSSKLRTTMLMNLASVVERADEQLDYAAGKQPLRHPQPRHAVTEDWNPSYGYGVLPAVYYFIGRSLHATPAQLGTLTLCRALVQLSGHGSPTWQPWVLAGYLQALSSPISGIAGDRFDRTHIVAGGCFLWGVMTAAIGLATSLRQAMVLCGFNGLGLALVIPCVQSLIADHTPPEGRGAAFGFMGFVAGLGGMLGGFFATNIAAFRPLHLDGWRFAFHLMAAVSIATGVLVLLYAADPRPKARALISPLLLGDRNAGSQGPQPQASGPFQEPAPLRHSPSGARLRSLASLQRLDSSRGSQPWRQQVQRAWREVLCVLRIKTFQIIILQGTVGSTPWQAMVYFTLWLQLMGFSDLRAATLMALFTGAAALGGLLGGSLGDRMSRLHPDRGRIITAQVSATLGLPLSVLLLKGLPGSAGEGSLLTHAAVLVVFGLAISWCGAQNSTMFSEIVPEQLRSTVFAFDRSFEGAVASCAAPLVGILAERLFGFRGSLADVDMVDERLRRSNADALANALLCCLVVPWTACLVAYCLLYRQYPRDRRNAKRLLASDSREVLKPQTPPP